jgi:serine/threonine protein phosphatase PrpC
MKSGTFYSLYGKALAFFLGKEDLNVYHSIEPDLDLVKKNKELGIELARGRGDRSHQEDRMGAMSISFPGDKKEIPEELMVDILKKSIEILDNQCREKYTDGAVLCMTVAVDGKLYIASVGDSHATLLSDEGEVQPLTASHNVQNPSLVKRKQEACAEVDGPYFWKKDSAIGLQPSRVIGDSLVRGHSGESPWVSTPDIYVIELPAQGKVILCSDGIYPAIGDPDFKKIQLTLASNESFSEKICGVIQAHYQKTRTKLDNHSVMIVDCGMLKKQTDFMLMYVADGHGGSNTVDHIAAHLPRIFAEQLELAVAAKNKPKNNIS